MATGKTTKSKSKGKKSSAITQAELDAIVGALNDLSIAFATASKAAQRVQTQLDALRPRLPPGPGTPNPKN